MPQVYVEEGASQYAQMFIDNGWDLCDDPYNADLIQLIGGADVSPELYGEEAHPSTYSSAINDEMTQGLYDIAQEKGIPIVGICRGSQFLSVMGGGKLWQDVDGHATGFGHDLLDIDTGIVIEGCSSTHHQQHRPASNAIIIATAFPQLCTRKACDTKEFDVPTYENDTVKLEWVNQDVEAFYYEHINALGYQAHPEFFHTDHPCQMYYFDIIAKYLKLRGNTFYETERAIKS